MENAFIETDFVFCECLCVALNYIHILYNPSTKWLKNTIVFKQRHKILASPTGRHSIEVAGLSNRQRATPEREVEHEPDLSWFTARRKPESDGDFSGMQISITSLLPMKDIINQRLHSFLLSTHVNSETF